MRLGEARIETGGRRIVEPTYERILAALDGTSASEAVLRHAAAHARAFHSELILVRVVPPTPLAPTGTDAALANAAGAVPDASLTSLVAAEESAARSYLATLAEPLVASGLGVVVSVRVGPVAENILREAEERKVGLIVLSTHGRVGIARMVVGSVADEVVRHAPCAVLLLRDVPPPRPVETGRVRSFREDAEQAGPLAQNVLGVRTVDVARIVGSVGRAHELGPDFRLLDRRRRDERYERILAAMERGDTLPPVELYKLGYNYYVLDGNHRVAAAKQLGQVDIDAYVTEFVPVNSEEQQRLFSERRAFERATGLTRVGANRPETYRRLERLIRDYAAEVGMAEEVDDEATLKNAARRWYSNVFYPTAQRIRAARLSESFPGERTADIFVHLADFRVRDAEQGRPELPWDEATQRFILGVSPSRPGVLGQLPGIRSLFRSGRARDEH